MSKPQIRASQIITTYGPGAMVDLPDDSVLVASLETWRYSKITPPPTVLEPRLIGKLEGLLGIRGLSLRKPPPRSRIGASRLTSGPTAFPSGSSCRDK